MAANQNTIRRFEETPLVGTTCQNPPRANAQVLDSIQALRQNDSPFRPYFAQVGLSLSYMGSLILVQRATRGYYEIKLCCRRCRMGCLDGGNGRRFCPDGECRAQEHRVRSG